MKRWIFIVIAAVILIGAVLGIVLGVKSCKDKKESVATNAYKIYYLQDKYQVGETIVLRVNLTSDKQITAISYVVNNGEERSFTIDYGESKNASEKIGSGKYYADTGTEILPTDQLGEGWYTFMFYATEADGTRHVLTKEPKLIQIVASRT